MEKKPTGIPSVMASEGGIVHPLTTAMSVVGYGEEYGCREIRSSPLEYGAKESESLVHFISPNRFSSLRVELFGSIALMWVVKLTSKTKYRARYR